MRQHYTQSKASRNLNIAAIYRLSEDEAYESLKQVRWAANEGNPICPHCGGLKASAFKSRPVFKCLACSRQFSLTSGTIFAHRKMPYTQILIACAEFVTNAKGKPSIELARRLGCDPMTAFVMLHKLREVMARESQDVILKGEVEIDGCYIGKSRRRANYKENRVDWRHRRAPKQQNVGVARQRGGPCLVDVNKRETQFLPFVVDRVDHNAVVYSDEALGWSDLAYTFEMRQVNHQECYSDGHACTNLAESFFSRVRRSEHGIYHHISGSYAQLYAEEIAWRENNRRLSDSERYLRLLSSTMRAPRSARMAGYWQKKKKKKPT